MKVNALTLVITLAASTAHAALVGHWGFSEAAGTVIADSSAFGNNGTLFNVRDDTWVPGVSGHALGFPGLTGGISTRVEIPNNASLQMTNSLTIAAWTYCYDLGRDAPILAKEGPNGQNSYWFGVFGPSGRGHWGILLDHDGWWGWDMNGRDIGNMPERVWVHLAVTWDGATARYYLNGMPTQTLNWYSSLFVGSSFVGFGVNSNFNYTSYYGLVDEVHLFNTAISGEEIAVLASTRAITGRVQLLDWAGMQKGLQVQFEVSIGGMLMESNTVTLGYAGMYSVPTEVTGAYDVRVKGSHWLSKLTTNVNIERVVSNLDFILTNGDVDGDNEIGPNDFAELSAAFGSMSGDLNWNVEADLDGDTEVGPSDFSVLSTNFGRAGE